MSDDYPRVSFECNGHWNASDQGFSKVVPADAIVIERSDIPTGRPVTYLGGTVTQITAGRGLEQRWMKTEDGPDAAHAVALACLGIEAYMREHPTVDEREVETLGQILSEEDEGRRGHDDASWADIARRLLATGKVHVDAEDGAR